MSKIARADFPFANGSSKKAYMTNIVDETSNNWMFDNIPGENKIITTSIIGSPNQLNYNMIKFMTAMTELSWMDAFNKVDLAPKIYALSIENDTVYNTYALYNNAFTMNKIFNESIKTYDLSQPITIHVLVESCKTNKMGKSIGYDRDIKGEDHLLELVNALVEKLIYHETLFIDFKAENICVTRENRRVVFKCLDFDPEFIITFKEIGLPIEEISKACRIYMLVMFIGLFMKSDPYGIVNKYYIQETIRRKYLAKYDIMFMLNVFIKLEQQKSVLCLMNKNPLMMLFHYFENANQSDINKVYYCSDINSIQASNNTVPLQLLYKTLVDLIYGSGEHNDWLTQISQSEIENIENYKNTHAKIKLPMYKRKLFKQSGSLFSSENEIKPVFVAPVKPSDPSPDMLNELPSFSPDFGANIGRAIIDEFIPRKKSRTDGGRRRIRRYKTRSLRRRKLRFVRNII